MSAPSFFSTSTASPCTAAPCSFYEPCRGGGRGEKGDKGDSGEGCCPQHGIGSPEGVVIAIEGTVYVDDLTLDKYFKLIGEDAYGWYIDPTASVSTVGVFIVGSIAQARAIPSAISNRILEINGDMTGGDGVNHLRYTWDQASVAANNNGSVLASTDLGAGRWIQN